MRILRKMRLALPVVSFCCLSSLLLAQDDPDRKIAPSDTIIIEVFGEKDLTVERRVQKSGTIVYPLLGILRVSGKTTSEVAEDLRSKLEDDYLVSPAVSVTVKEYRLRTVTVLGEVQKSGSVLLPAEVKMDVLEAIASAGGFTNLANKKKIHLTREGKKNIYSLDQLMKETDPAKKIWLEPGDVVYVPESMF